MNIRIRIIFLIGLCHALNCLFAQNISISTPNTSVTLQTEAVSVNTILQDEAIWAIVSLKDKIYPFYVKVLASLMYVSFIITLSRES
jgi:hypothetical protein